MVPSITQLFPFFAPENIEQVTVEMPSTMHIFLHSKFPLFMFEFMQNWTLSSFMKIQSSVLEMLHAEREREKGRQKY
jgi:hypothetical protein